MGQKPRSVDVERHGKGRGKGKGNGRSSSSGPSQRKTKSNDKRKAPRVSKAKIPEKQSNTQPSPQKEKLSASKSSTSQQIMTEKEPSGAFQKASQKVKSIYLIIIILMMIGLLIVGALILYSLSSPNIVLVPQPLVANNSSPGFSFCTTPECAIASSYVIKNMDAEVEPCDNFYMSACGKFSETRIPSEKFNSYDTTTRDSVLALSEIKNIMNSNNSKSEAERRLKTIYNKCLNDKRDYMAMKREIEKLGGCEAVNRLWNPSTFSLTDTLIAMAKLIPENLGILRFETGEMRTSENKTLINMLSHNPAMVSKQKREVLAQELESMFYVIGEKTVSYQKPHDLKQQVKEILDFDEQLHSIAPVDGRLDKDIPPIYAFDTKRFVESVIPPGRKFEFHVVARSYFKNLNALLLSSRFGVIQNYLVARFLKALFYFNWHENEPIKSQDLCINHLFQLLPGTTGVVHALRKIKPESVNAAEKMVEDLKVQFLAEFEANEWMDQETKRNAVQKLKDMQYHIGYPKHFGDKEEKYVKNLFDKFNILPTDSFFESAIKIHSSYSKDYFLAALEYEPMGFSVQIFNWNALYSPWPNSLMVSSLLLRSPVFDATLPDYYNHGAVGFILGHEIGHGFDSLERTDVWSNETKKVFKTKTECIQKQFGEYKLHGRRIDGLKTSGENTADSIGLNMAFKTMQRKLAGLEDHQILRLPGLQKFTPDQMFFYSVTVPFCGFPIKPHGLKDALDDSHTPNRLRINGMMTNSDEFARAFNCKQNSPMNPEKKCKIF